MDNLDEQVKRVEDQLRTLADSMKSTTGAFEDTIDQLVSVNKMDKTLGEEKKKEYQQLQKTIQKQKEQERAIENVSNAILGVIPGLMNIGKAAGAVSLGLYSAKDAFTSLTPTLEFASKTFQNLTTALGDLASGVSILGFSFGDAPKGLAKFVNTGVDFAVTLASQQLQFAQNVANSFASISASGIMFSGSVTEMANAASASGQTLNRMTEFVAKNNQVLSGLGGNLAQTATNLLLMGRNIGQNNQALLVSYGSYEALNDGIAQYVNLQRQLGYVDINNQTKLTQGATEYLIRQRELTALTGKRADQLAAEEQRRRLEVDYALKQSRLSEAQQKNVEATMQIAGRISPAAEAYIKEYFATNGRVVSKEALTFQAMNQQVAKTLTDTLAGATTMDASEFRKNTASILQQNAPALMAFAKSMEELASINRAAMNPILTQQAEAAAGILSNMNLFKDATKLFAQAEKDAAAARAPVTDDKTKGIADAIEKLVTNQRDLDRLAAESIPRMKVFVDAGYLVQKSVIELSDTTAEVISELSKGAAADVQKLRIAVEKLLNTKFNDRSPNNTSASGPSVSDETNAGDPEAQSSVPNFNDPPRSSPGQTRSTTVPPSSMPQNAYGGVANEPSIAGEDGPEAIIPLAKGNVPLDIDWTPMVRALYELIDRVEQGNDINERILKASY